MLILEKSCFLHTPKTGGSWVKKALIESKMKCHSYTLYDNVHVELKDCPCPNKFRFAFVRHPVDLYRSYWQFKMTCGWDHTNPFDMECRSDNFHKFVHHVLDKFPGAISQWLINFVGEPDNEIEFIGKYENLVDDLISALKAAGENFDEEFIRNFPPYNVSDKNTYLANYTDRLESEVRSAESLGIRRFNYL